LNSTAHVSSAVASIGPTCLEYQRTPADTIIGCEEKETTAQTRMGGKAIPLHTVVMGAYLPNTELPNKPLMSAGSERASAIGFVNVKHPTTDAPDLIVS